LPDILCRKCGEWIECKTTVDVPPHVCAPKKLELAVGEDGVFLPTDTGAEATRLAQEVELRWNEYPRLQRALSDPLSMQSRLNAQERVLTNVAIQLEHWHRVAMDKTLTEKKLMDERDELERQLQEQATGNAMQGVAMDSEVAQYEAKLRVAREAIETYGLHEQNCPCIVTLELCTCWVRRTLEKLK